MNLEELLRQPEGKTLEFKASLGASEPVLKSIVAFANTAGGTLLFGVEDKTRRVLGISEPLSLEERLASLISDAIRPRLLPDLAILPWRKTHLVAVQVHPSPSRPHYLKALGVQYGVYIRVGSTDRRADGPLLDELRRAAGDKGFDEQVLTHLDSEALDFRAASECFEPVRGLKQRDLIALGLVVKHAGHLRPTNGGMLLFGQDRERWFPDAYIQAGRFQGIDRVNIIDTQDLRTHLPAAVDQALAFVRRHDNVALTIRGARHSERSSIPPAAVREAVINAVVHADYAQRGAPIRLSLFDDRLEIENPGLLPFGLTVPDILLGVSKLRNRVIGRVFKELGLIEQWGSGVARMVAACREAGLVEPVFEEIGRHFRVTMGKTKTAASGSDDIEQAILGLLRDGHGHSTAEIARAIRRTPRATQTRLGHLVSRGVVAVVGTGPRDPKRRYFQAS